MENLICSAYAYIEFNGDFIKYSKAVELYSTEQQVDNAWKEICLSYDKVSSYMDDQAITQAWNLVMNVL